MQVELSDNKGQGRKNSQKLFVGNIADGTTDTELRALFERYTKYGSAISHILIMPSYSHDLMPSCPHAHQGCRG